MTEQRRPPAIDRLLRDPAFAPLIAQHGLGVVKARVRAMQADVRANGDTAWVDDIQTWAARAEHGLANDFGNGLTPVYNLTGTLLHTNLGRALLSEQLARTAIEAATHPVALEYDLDDGARGDRDRLIEPMLCALTGAEAATVVNNNAAAVLLVLNTLALGKRVPVSRGELIEIGGSFRMPDIIERAGCRILEVGTTNRTHPKDFENAIDADTGVLLKVHPSNFRVEGFTLEVETPALSAIARRHQVPLVIDLGSGALIDLARFGLPHEPTPGETLRQGADVVTFSGDKLLGAVQAGLIVGRRDLIERIRRNPLKRALRTDKITLAVLRETLKLYQEPERAMTQIPLLRAMSEPLAEIHQRARIVRDAIAPMLDHRFVTTVIDSQCQIGSGSLPGTALPSAAVSIRASDRLLRALITNLRALPTPVIGRLHDGAILLDLRATPDVADLVTELAQLRVPTK